MSEGNCTAPFPARHNRQPVVSEHHRAVVIHVERPDLIDYNWPLEEWLLRARPLPAEMHLVHAVLRGELKPSQVNVRARVSRIRKLMIRAVRAHRAGQFLRATKLVACARVLDWHQGGVEEIDLLNGLRHDLFHVDSVLRSRWSSQADWWAGGSWVGAAASNSFWMSLSRRAADEVRQLERLRSEVAGLIDQRVATLSEG